MTLKDIQKSAATAKFWLVFLGVMLPSLTALGISFDRPALKSELVAIQLIATNNAKNIIQIKIDDAQRRLWEWKDRYDFKPNPDLKQRIRELEEHKRRLEELKKKKDG